jgi:hypothetical protein
MTQASKLRLPRQVASARGYVSRGSLANLNANSRTFRGGTWQRERPDQEHTHVDACGNGRTDSATSRSVEGQ